MKFLFVKGMDQPFRLKEFSNFPTLYLDEACMTGISNNLVIYGHHMNDGSMFADFCKYTDADYNCTSSISVYSLYLKVSRFVLNLKAATTS